MGVATAALPIHLPLCNPTSDKTSYEVVHGFMRVDEIFKHKLYGVACYIMYCVQEEWMMSQLLSPVGKDSSNVAQALIKLFAVSKCTIFTL